MWTGSPLGPQFFCGSCCQSDTSMSGKEDSVVSTWQAVTRDTNPHNDHGTEFTTQGIMGCWDEHAFEK